MRIAGGELAILAPIEYLLHHESALSERSQRGGLHTSRKAISQVVVVPPGFARSACSLSGFVLGFDLG
jgi:hypothetical protein